MMIEIKKLSALPITSSS